MNFEELKENFELFDDWEERYAYLIEIGRKLPAMDEADKNNETKVDGCTSQVWIKPETRDKEGLERLYFTADSDAHIVRGLIAILMVLYNGKTREEIASVDINDVFADLGLESHLSPNRRNGFFAMVERIKNS